VHSQINEFFETRRRANESNNNTVTGERVQCQVRQDYDYNRIVFLRLLSKTVQPQALSIDQLLQYSVVYIVPTCLVYLLDYY